MLKPSKLIKKAVMFLTALLILTVLVVNIGVCAAPPKRVAIFPFTMNSPQDLGFLQNGLFSMLSSRLSDPGKVDVLDREAVDQMLAQAEESSATKGTLSESKARIIGANMGVDYIIFGSLTYFGEGASLDASMVDITGKGTTLFFGDQSKNLGDVIPLVNRFAGDINQKVLHRVINNERYAQVAPQAAPPVALQVVPQAPDAPGALQQVGEGTGVGGGLMASQQDNSQGFSTHLNFEGVITAMAVGDLNKDGRVQVVTATDSDLMIHQLEGNRLVQMEKLEFSSTNRIVSLDIADINKNGYPEIFVTSLTIHRDGVQSFVVEYNGSEYVTLVEGEASYYRVIKTADNPPVLLRQNYGSSPFNGRIYTMTAAGNTYKDEQSIRVPRDTSVLSLTRGKVTSAMDQYVMINKHGRLVVAKDSGSKGWASTKGYGLTAHYWLLPKNDTDASFQERLYLHPRIKFYDIGSDGKLELFVVKNNEVGGGAFGRYKRFNNGNVQMLSWNGIAMTPVLETTPVQGWISDFSIADMDGDGVDELIVSVVTHTKQSVISEPSTSSIISYKL
jgi:TolB-like protein